MADLHLHTLYSDGTAGVATLLDWVGRHTALDLIAITDHDRIDGGIRALELWETGNHNFQVAVGEEVTTRHGHVLALFLTRPIPPFRTASETVERIHDQGGLAIAPHPMGLPLSIGRGRLARIQEDPRPERRFDAIELVNASLGGRVRRAERERFNAERLRLPGLGSSDAHVLEGVATAWTWFAGTTAADFRAALRANEVEAAGGYWSVGHNMAVYGRQLVAKARHLRHTLRPTGEWR